MLYWIMPRIYKLYIVWWTVESQRGVWGRKEEYRRRRKNRGEGVREDWEGEKRD